MNLLLSAIFAAVIGQSALTGTWSAQRVYGPVFDGGRIVVSRFHGWSATVAGMSRHAGSGAAPDFIFDDGSELRLRVSGAELAGQWIQPGDAENAHAKATPVAFLHAGAGLWRGIARPVVNVQHLTLVVSPQTAGGTRAYLLNPERNAGLFVGVRALQLRGQSIVLHRDGADDITGRWLRQSDAVVLRDPGLPGTFVFKRVAAWRPRPFVYRRPAALGDGWSTATLKDAGIDEAAVVRFLNAMTSGASELRAPHIQSLLIARHGHLVLDAYFDGFGPDRPHDVRSAGKSVATLMVGKALAKGTAFSPHTPVSSILSGYSPFKNYSSSKDLITVAHLMAMSAGYACDDNDDGSPGNEDRMQTQTVEADWYKYTLDLPMAFPPGGRALYCSADINLLGAIIEEETKSWLPDFFYENFARPMQFGDYGMWLTPPPTYTAYMAGGDDFRPRDFLKFGELFLEGGRWNGKLIVSPDWLTQVAAKHSFVENGGGDYGYGWHLATYRVGGRALRAINAGGNGGQLLYIFPQADMTVMLTAGNYGDYRTWSRFQDQIPNAILAATRLHH